MSKVAKGKDKFAFITHVEVKTFSGWIEGEEEVQRVHLELEGGLNKGTRLTFAMGMEDLKDFPLGGKFRLTLDRLED